MKFPIWIRLFNIKIIVIEHFDILSPKGGMGGTNENYQIVSAPKLSTLQQILLKAKL